MLEIWTHFQISISEPIDEVSRPAIWNQVVVDARVSNKKCTKHMVDLPTDSKQNHESRMETLLNRGLSRAKDKLSGKRRICVVRESLDLEKRGASTLR